MCIATIHKIKSPIIANNKKNIGKLNIIANSRNNDVLIILAFVGLDACLFLLDLYSL